MAQDEDFVQGTLDTEHKAYCVVLRGDIDVFTFQFLRDFFVRWKNDTEEPHLLVDLTKVAYMGSSGWALLFSQNHVAKRRDGMVVVYGLNNRLKRSLTQISGNRHLLKIAEDREDALRMINAGEESNAA